MTEPRRRLGARALTVGMAVAVLAVAVLTGCSTSTTPAPTTSPAASSVPPQADPVATGRAQVTRFLTLLQAKDAAGLDAFLDPAFQLQRADGSGATKAEYLAAPAEVKTFELGPDVIAVQNGNLLTVRWALRSDEKVNGQALRRGLAPRLSTFVWRDGDWKLLSHANFSLPAS